jgi:protein required for attachment to host cells
MDSITLPAKSLVIVCDGAKAILLRNEGNAETVKLHAVETFDEKHAPTHELGTDRPGRVHASQGAASGSDGPDWHEDAEAGFLGRMATMLDKIVTEQSVTHLVVVAPPKALGILRGLFTAPVQKVIQAEIAKDYTGMPVNEIEKHLAAS